MNGLEAATNNLLYLYFQIFISHQAEHQPETTSKTLNKDLADIIIREQNEDLDDLQASVERLGDVGMTIHDELAGQVLTSLISGTQVAHNSPPDFGLNLSVYLLLMLLWHAFVDVCYA